MTVSHRVPPCPGHTQTTVSRVPCLLGTRSWTHSPAVTVSPTLGTQSPRSSRGTHRPLGPAFPREMRLPHSDWTVSLLAGFLGLLFRVRSGGPGD
jgi:hypothetical protein